MRKKHTQQLWIPILMILSAILLCLFVIQWLSLQYSSVEKELEKDVRVDLRKTSDQLLDSMMLHLISKTITKEYHSIDTVLLNENPTNRHIHKTDSIIEKTKIVDVRVDVDTIYKQQKWIEVREKKPVNGQITIVQEDFFGSKNEQLAHNLFAKGLGVFVKKLSNQDAISDVIMITNEELDTLLCRRLLKTNWQQKGLKYELVFQSINRKPSPQNLKQNEPIIYTGDPLFQHRFGIRLNNKNSYIWWQIIPQLIFALILIVATVGAFVFVYRSYRKQVLLNELRTDFINNISHELKTPVSTVLVTLEALRHYNRKSDPIVMDEYLQLMTLEVKRLDKLINLVLTNSLLEEKNDFLQLESTNLVELIEQVLLTYQWQLNQGNAHIDFQKSSDVILATVDPIHLQGVLLNLLDNCVKYGGESPTIHLQITEHRNTIVIEVADEGPGIQQKYIGQLFEKFFRVPTGNVHNVVGYGLGLYYCAQIMQHHHGSIEVENLPVKGCVFRLTLPKPSNEN